MESAYRDAAAAARERVEEARTDLAARLARCSPWLVLQLAPDVRAALRDLGRALEEAPSELDELLAVERRLDIGRAVMDDVERFAPRLEQELRHGPREGLEPTRPTEEWGETGVEQAMPALVRALESDLTRFKYRPVIHVRGPRVDCELTVGVGEEALTALLELDMVRVRRVDERRATEEWQEPLFEMLTYRARIRVPVSALVPRVTLTPRPYLARWFAAFVRGVDDESDPLEAYRIDGDDTFARALFADEQARGGLRSLLRHDMHVALGEGAFATAWSGGMRVDRDAITKSLAALLQFREALGRIDVVQRESMATPP